MEKPLAETNPYLKDLQKRAELLRRQVINSSAFEGIRGLQSQLPSLVVGSARKAASKKAVRGA